MSNEKNSGSGIPMLREIIEKRKEKAVEILSSSYAKNNMPLEEYERLVEYINKIESERELSVVEKIVDQYSAEETKSGKTDRYDDDDSEYGPAEDDGPNDYSRYQYGGIPGGVAILSNRTVSGPLKSRSQYVSFLGSQQIKIRKSDLSKRRSTLEIVSILGETTIFVEPGIQVNNKAIPILGDARVDRKFFKQYRGDGPEINVTGFALLGSINVKPLNENPEDY